MNVHDFISLIQQMFIEHLLYIVLALRLNALYSTEQNRKKKKFPGLECSAVYILVAYLLLVR